MFLPKQPFKSISYSLKDGLIFHTLDGVDQWNTCAILHSNLEKLAKKYEIPFQETLEITSYTYEDRVFDTFGHSTGKMGRTKAYHLQNHDIFKEDSLVSVLYFPGDSPHVKYTFQSEDGRISGSLQTHSEAIRDVMHDEDGVAYYSDKIRMHLDVHVICKEFSQKDKKLYSDLKKAVRPANALYLALFGQSK